MAHVLNARNSEPLPRSCQHHTWCRANPTPATPPPRPHQPPRPTRPTRPTVPRGPLDGSPGSGPRISPGGEGMTQELRPGDLHPDQHGLTLDEASDQDNPVVTRVRSRRGAGVPAGRERTSTRTSRSHYGAPRIALS